LIEDLDFPTAKLAMEAMSTESFELFAQALLLEVYGVNFEATGGVHDGGQDGYLRAASNSPDNYAQISKEKDTKGKIKKTLKRLSESGRQVSNLRYVTSQDCPERDLIEPEIEKEFGCTIRIIDRRSIIQQMIKSDQLTAVFRSHASTQINELIKISRAEISTYNNPSRLSIVTYLEIHAEDQPQEDDFLTIAADAAIYQALEGTNPTENLLRTEDQIIANVYERCPALKKHSSIRINDRLARLSQKRSSPRIRKHPEGYGLPWEIRNDLNDKNVLIATLESDFLTSIRERIIQKNSDLNTDTLEEIVRVTFIAINETFKANALNMAKFLSNDNEEAPEINSYDFVEASINPIHTGNHRIVIRNLSEEVIRNIFYSGSDIEQSYMLALFKLNSVEFILNGDEPVMKYFQQMMRKLRLVIGTDVLVRAFSEYCIKPELQSTVSMLKILKSCGVKLFVTRPILNELYHHVRTTIKEFNQSYASWEQHAKIAATKNSDKILIRAYFYAKLEPNGHHFSPSNFPQYINKIANRNWFERGKEDSEAFSKLVLRRFGLEKLSNNQIDEVVNHNRVSELAAQLAEFRKNDDLAENDAMVASYVNMYRDINEENNHNSVYGFSTWWLTEENRVVRLARKIGMRNKFVMHPHTLMSYVIANPKSYKIINQNSSNFPLNFGLKITERVHEDGFKAFLKSVEDFEAVDEDVQHIRMQQAVNELLGKRTYAH